MAAFVDYLVSLKTRLGKLGSTSELCLTVGNESCDLDSIVCALVHAHYRALAEHSSGVVSLPLLQCVREDLELNQEAILLFDMLGIDSSKLLCLDDISQDILSAVGKLSLVLVDHNVPTGMFQAFSSSVTQIIDHHQAGADSVANQASVVTTMEMTGSCASLIAREVVEDAEYTVEEPVAILLLSAILLDTGDLKAAKRVTTTDETAVEELSKFLPSTFSRDDHFSKLFKARFDISNLSVQQALKKDYKECVVNEYRIGFSTVPGLLSELLTQPNINTDFMDFFSTHGLNALIVLGVFIMDPAATKIQRQICVFQPEAMNSEFTESIINVFEANSELNCERTDLVPEFQGVLLQQKNADMSRKHIIPIVTSFVTSIVSEYPRSDLSPTQVTSPTQITLQESEPSTSGAAVASDEPFPLEPDITVLSNPTGEDLSPPEAVKPDTIRTAAKPRSIPEYTSAEEFKERRSHRYVSVGGEETLVSMDMVGPYRKTIQHAGYIGATRQALVVISACHLPPRSLPNYNHVVHHTFYYVLSVLDQLIVDDYTIVYLHSGAPRKSMPSLPLLHKFYKTLDRSKKFWRKVHFIPTLQDLSNHVKVDSDYIPSPVKAVDNVIMSQRPAGQKYQTSDTESKQKETGEGEPVATGEPATTGKEDGEEVTSPTEAEK